MPVELFSITTSAVATSCFTSARPSGRFRSTPKLRFDRLDAANDGVISPPMILRMKSGYARLSILMTSAPCSANMRAALHADPTVAEVDDPQTLRKGRARPRAPVAAAARGAAARVAERAPVERREYAASCSPTRARGRGTATRCAVHLEQAGHHRGLDAGRDLERHERLAARGSGRRRGCRRASGSARRPRRGAAPRSRTRSCPSSRRTRRMIGCRTSRFSNRAKVCSQYGSANASGEPIHSHSARHCRGLSITRRTNPSRVGIVG